MKHLFWIVGSIAWALALGGCSTAYQPRSFTGGFSETQLAPDVFRVAFNGNGYTAGERAQDFCLLRAADLTVSRGYSHFFVLDERNGATNESYTMPGQAYTTGGASVIGGRAYYNEFTSYTPAQTINVFKPSTGLLIRCIKGAPPHGQFAFDAHFLQQSLRSKYRIKE